MLNESKIPGTPSPIVDTTEESVISVERRIIAVHLLGLHAAFKNDLEGLESEDLQEDERSAIIKEMIENFAISVRRALVGGAHHNDALSIPWAIQEIVRIESMLEASESPTPKDASVVLSFINDFLAKLYPSRTIEEINELYAEEGREVEEQEDELDLKLLPPEKRDEIIHDQARLLYEFRYYWGYYPAVTRGLNVRGVRLNDAIDDRRRELEMQYFDKDLNRGYNLDRIRQRIGQGKAGTGEVELYSLWRNKITGNYMGGVSGAIHLLKSLSPEYEQFYNEAHELSERFIKYREIMSKRAEETGTTEGYIPFGDKKFSDSLRRDARKTEQLIERVLMALYPSTKKIQKDGKEKFDRRELEKKLGIKH